MKKKDISHEDCRASLRNIGDALYVIGGKWKLKIIVALSEGNSRFNDLQRTINGISAKVLSNELKEMEANGLVIRHVYDQWPVAVAYELTEYSQSLTPVLIALDNWGAMHSKKIRRQMNKVENN
ncbi:MAG TPA: transcriptional regulator [Cytophagales bacterium]|nr:transcriptional regulator [Cytophagales bacterium]HCR54301.1 transcriptional regulator [Cytophagales bacterium]